MVLRAVQSRGYVLLMTLMLLPVVVLVMAGIARLSVQKAIGAQDAAEDLQRRWAQISCRSAFLARAEQILERAERQTEGPVSEAQVNFALGRQRVAVILSDEQAKANLNTVLVTRGTDAATQSLHRLLRDGPEISGLRVALQPAPAMPDLLGAPATPRLGGHATAAMLGSYGQVFDRCTPAALLGDVSTVPGAQFSGQPQRAISHFTLWGGGQINLRRASRAALLEHLVGVLGPSEVERLLQLRTEHPGLTARMAISALALSKERQEAALGLLSDFSNCHGLWIVIQDQRRRHYEFVAGSAGGRRAAHLAW